MPLACIMQQMEKPPKILQVRNVPARVYSALEKRAEANQRSLAAEVRVILEETTAPHKKGHP